MRRFETRLSSKGQIVISREIREELGLKPRQTLVEEVDGGKIVLTPIPRPSKLRGSLKSVAKHKSVEEISRWIDEGWE
jgi:AbrB family looped-hinge helix DNA binding protein